MADTAVSEQFGEYRTVHYLSGPGVEAGHVPHWERPEQFNRLLAEFAADVSPVR